MCKRVVSRTTLAFSTYGASLRLYQKQLQTLPMSCLNDLTQMHSEFEDSEGHMRSCLKIQNTKVIYKRTAFLSCSWVAGSLAGSFPWASCPPLPLVWPEGVCSGGLQQRMLVLWLLMEAVKEKHQ